MSAVPFALSGKSQNPEPVKRKSNVLSCWGGCFPGCFPPSQHLHLFGNNSQVLRGPSIPVNAGGLGVWRDRFIPPVLAGSPCSSRPGAPHPHRYSAVPIARHRDDLRSRIRSRASEPRVNWERRQAFPSPLLPRILIRTPIFAVRPWAIYFLHQSRSSPTYRV